jgi:hypothetical protein
MFRIRIRFDLALSGTDPLGNTDPAPVSIILAEMDTFSVLASVGSALVSVRIRIRIQHFRSMRIQLRIQSLKAKN